MHVFHKQGRTLTKVTEEEIKFPGRLFCNKSYNYHRLRQESMLSVIVLLLYIFVAKEKWEEGKEVWWEKVRQEVGKEVWEEGREGICEGGEGGESRGRHS